jgi:hypothetical protein
MNPGTAAVSSPDFVSSVISGQDSTLARGAPAGIPTFSLEPYEPTAMPEAEPLVRAELRMTPSRELGELWSMYRFWRKGLA